MKKESQGKINKVIGIVSSMPFAIGLLCVLALLSVIGTLIAQNRSVDTYRATYGDFWYSMFDTFGFFDMYHSWWYLSLLSLLLLSLVIATVRHGYYIVAGVKPIKVVPALPRKHALKVEIQIDEQSNKSIEQVGNELSDEMANLGFKSWINNSQTDQNQRQLFSRKGTIGKLSFFPVHIGLAIVLIGGLVSTQFGFRGVMNIIQGDSVSEVFIKEGDDYAPIPLPFSVKNDQFSIDFYEMGKPSSFQSTLSVYELSEDNSPADSNRPLIATKTISVNDPLRLDDITLYQANFGDAGSPVDFQFTDLSKSDFPQHDISSAVHKILEDPGTGNRISILDLNEHTVLNLSNDPMESRMKDVGPSIDIKIQTPEDGTITYRSYQHYPHILSFKRMGEKKWTTEELGFPPSDKNMIDLLASYLEQLYSKGSSGSFTDQQRKEAFAITLKSKNISIDNAPELGAAIGQTQQILEKHRLPALFTLKAFDRIFYTGLQVTKDPGAWIIWLGSIMLMVGLLLIYIIEYRMWISIKQAGPRHFLCEIVATSSRTNIVGIQQLRANLNNIANNKGFLLKEVQS